MISNNRPLFFVERRRAPRGRGPRGVFAVLGVAAVLLFAWFFRAPLAEFLVQAAAPLLRARFSPVLQTEPPHDRDALYAENLELKRMLGRSVAFERVLAAVLLRPPAVPYDTLLIDAGSEQNVAVGDWVAAGGVVLGEVSEVYARAARVALYSAPSSEFDAILRRGDKTLPITLQGQGGGSLQAQVPAGAGVAVGDEAVVPGLYAGVVANVVGVGAGPSESFNAVYFQLPLAVSSLHFIEVWKTPSHDPR